MTRMKWVYRKECRQVHIKVYVLEIVDAESVL
jgi:hypothetical protein